MDWPRAILTDSGGFQVFSLTRCARSTEDGVLFQSHLDGVAAHVHAGVDGGCATRARQRHLHGAGRVPRLPRDPRGGEGVDGSHGPLGEARDSALARANAVDRTAHALFPIVQGGMYADLRAECARELVELDAPGYAIGGLSVGEPRELSQEMTEATAPLLPRDKPRYVMGVGMPDELPEYVSRGVDMMDCVLPSRNARNGYLFTSEGRVIIKHAQYKDDPRSGRPGLRLLHVPALQPGLPAASVPGGGDPVLYARLRSTTCGDILTSCARCERLFYPGHFPTILVRCGPSRVAGS